MYMRNADSIQRIYNMCKSETPVMHWCNRIAQKDIFERCPFAR